MNYQVHETAIVDNGAQIGADSRLWQSVHFFQVNNFLRFYE